MPIIRAAQAPRFDLDGLHFLGLTSPGRGATEICTWQLDIDAGAASVAHRINHEEVFIPRHGTFSVVLDGEEFELGPGDACAVPAHCLLRVVNRSDKAASALVCISAGFSATDADGVEIQTPPWAQ